MPQQRCMRCEGFVQDVQKQIDEAKESKAPPIEDLWNNIYQDPMVAFPSPAVCLDGCVAYPSKVSLCYKLLLWHM